MLYYYMLSIEDIKQKYNITFEIESDYDIIINIFNENINIENIDTVKCQT